MAMVVNTLARDTALPHRGVVVNIPHLTPESRPFRVRCQKAVDDTAVFGKPRHPARFARFAD
ncbi:hypothetical protein [Streptomyces similanensis]|uniref:hypothetical protein n=1 Tax=Streptomyces similanensis TaxID=1274988 RepID=UPI0031EB309A